VSSGGAIASLVAASGAGWVAPPGDAPALAAVLRHALTDPAARHAAGSAGLELARRFAWDHVLAPLLEFCRAPWRDPSKEHFGSRLPTNAPRDPLGFRVRRKLRQWTAR
jgi:hypothetical protein